MLIPGPEVQRLQRVIKAATAAGITLEPVLLPHRWRGRIYSRRKLSYQGHLIKVIFCGHIRQTCGRDYWRFQPCNLSDVDIVIIHVVDRSGQAVNFIMPVQVLQTGIKISQISVDDFVSTDNRGTKSRINYRAYKNAWHSIPRILGKKIRSPA